MGSMGMAIKGLETLRMGSGRAPIQGAPVPGH